MTELQVDKVTVKNIEYDKHGLVPVIVTDFNTKEVLMLGYMNRDAVLKSLELQEAVFYSRSRKELWHKGSTSGNTLRIKSIKIDCDCDCLQLVVVVGGEGKVCHTGSVSCFFRTIDNS